MRLLVLALLLPGCWLVFDDHGSGGGDDVCIFDTASAPAPLRNPQTLVCESFGDTCDPSCGPCPAIARAPIPTWGVCGGACDALGEATCGATPGCRTAKDAACAIRGDCATDFLGCFPLDNAPDPTADCFTRSADLCSRNNACVAFHRTGGCSTQPCSREFVLCMPRDQAPGACFAPVVCARTPPPCPENTRPGVADGCFTDACIPLDLCEAQRGS